MPVDGSSPVLLDGDEWQAYFRDFKRSAFRLEVHQTYTMPTEDATVRDFLAGAAKPDGFNVPWHQTIRDHAAAGRTMTRAKVVRRPLTPYSRYLFEWCIPGNVAAGENYQVVDVTDQPNPGLPEQDFWLFDETTVVHLNYRPDGTQINRELIQDPDIGKYLAWRDLALLDLTDRENPGLPDQDFWMFDSSKVVAMNYRSDGTQISRDLLEVPDLNQYRQWKELALSLSVPFSEYGAD